MDTLMWFGAIWLLCMFIRIPNLVLDTPAIYGLLLDALDTRSAAWTVMAFNVYIPSLLGSPAWLFLTFPFIFYHTPYEILQAQVEELLEDSGDE